MIYDAVFAVDMWFKTLFARVVQIDDGYAVQSRSFPFFTAVYLDIPDSSTLNPGGEPKEPRWHWWSQPNSIRRYAVSDIETVVARLELLTNYKQPLKPKPIRATPVTDIECARVYHKLKDSL